MDITKLFKKNHTFPYSYLAILLLSLASYQAVAADKYYIVIGQSNARNISDFGGLDVKLSDAQTTAHIIPCAHGGQKIIKFLPSWDSATYFGDCLARVGNKKISGIVFWQGEHDTYLAGDANQWAGRARQVMLWLRVELDTGNIPIVMVLLNSAVHTGHTHPGWPTIRAAQKRMVAPGLYKLDSDRYPFSPDFHHLVEYGAVSSDIAAIFKAVQPQP